MFAFLEQGDVIQGTVRGKVPSEIKHAMPRQRQQLLHYGQAAQLHEQDDQETIFHHRQADYAAANKVSMAIFIDRLTRFFAAFERAHSRIELKTRNKKPVNSKSPYKVSQQVS